MRTGHQAKEPCNCLYIQQHVFAATRQLFALEVSFCHLGLQNRKCQLSVVQLDLMGMPKSYCFVETILALNIPSLSCAGKRRYYYICCCHRFAIMSVVDVIVYLRFSNAVE